MHSEGTHCPNSCARVSTSRNVSVAGLPPTGSALLHTMCATGRRTAEPAGASRRERPATSSIQAPPRFSAGRL